MKVVKPAIVPGLVFNRLTVIEDTKKVNKHNRKLWRCRCVCGKFIEVDGNRLKQGNAQSCGCLRVENGRKTVNKINPRNTQGTKVSKFNQLVRSYKGTAKKRNLNFELKEIQIKDIVSKPCHYCGYYPKDSRDKNCYKYIDTYNGIDRIDNSLGYNVQNCVPCCEHCNYAKNNYSYEEFINWIKRLVNFNK